jgi:hypothetical protein
MGTSAIVSTLGVYASKLMRQKTQAGPHVSSSGRMVVWSGRIGAMGILKEFTAIAIAFGLLRPIERPIFDVCRKSQPTSTEDASRNGLRSDTTNSFPCVTTKPG